MYRVTLLTSNKDLLLLSITTTVSVLLPLIIPFFVECGGSQGISFRYLVEKRFANCKVKNNAKAWTLYGNLGHEPLENMKLGSLVNNCP